MDEKTDYIDISPEKGGAKGIKSTVFQESEMLQIRNNPANLTKEGILKKIELWSSSANKHVLIKYQAMLKQCQNIAESGMTEDGRVILSRSMDGTPKWLDAKPAPAVKEIPKPPVKSTKEKGE